MQSGHKKLSSIKYEISKPTKKYIIFHRTFNKNWQLNSQQPTQLGTINVYGFKEERILNYKRFNVYLVSYIISIAMLLLLLSKILTKL